MSTTFVSLQWFPTPLSLFFFFLVALLSIFFLWRRRKEESLKGLNLPPSPSRLPIIGNLHQLGKLPHQSLSNLSQKYGPVMLLHLGYVPTLVVSSPEAAKDVLKTHDLDTCTRPARTPGPVKMSYNHSDVAFSPYGNYWREARKILTLELLSMKRVNSFGLAREEEVARLMELLSENSSKPVELDWTIFALLDRIVGSVAFGKYYGIERFEGKDFQCVLNEAMNVLTSFSNEDFFPTWWGRAIDKLVGHSSRLDKSFHDLDGYLQMLVDKHRGPARPSGAGDFVDVLISLQRDPERSIALNDSKIKGLLMNAFLGAVDTSSITILWAMFELMKNPRVMKKAQAEIRSCMDKNPNKVEADDITNMNYLKTVVKETLRLHPVGPLMLPHETIRWCRIGGYDVGPGTRIFVNVWAIGRDPKSWENPEEFNPDRFVGNDIDFKGQNFEFLPFGSGRRMCPGLTLGVTTVEFVLANLLYRFDWELPEGMKPEDMIMEEEGGLTIHNKVPLRLVPIKFNNY